MENLFGYDFYRYTGQKWSFLKNFRYLLSNQGIGFLYLLRRTSAAKGRRSPLLRLLLKRCAMKYGLEFSPGTTIGKGLYLGHAYDIGVNPMAVIGENVNLHKGVSIAQENRGKRKGAPIIGSCVWVGINATIVGNVRVGDDVLIAAGAFVNRDVPSHSIVIGNPCRIIPRANATCGYINNTVGEPFPCGGNRDNITMEEKTSDFEVV